MASVLKVLLAFLHKLYSSGNYIKRFSWRFVLFLAFLGRKLRRPWHGESGTARRKSTPTAPPSPCARASSRTVSRDSAGSRENLVACSTVPTSARGPGPRDPGRGRTRQPAAAIPPVSLYPPVYHPSRLARAAYRERGQDTSRSTGRRSRSSSAGGLDNRTILPNRPAIPPSLTSAVVKVRDPRAGVMTTEPRDAAAAGSPRRPPSDPRVVSDPRLPRGKILRLMTSEEVPRYKKGITIRKKPTKSYKIEPLTIALPYLQEQSHSVQGQRSEDCRPWIPKTHPKGARYFFDRDRRLFTDTDMHNREFREEIEEFYYCLQKILIADQLTIPSNEYDLVLDIQVNGDGRKQWSYYYACHDSETRCLFWLHTCEAADIISRVYGVESPAHIKHRLEALYWSHWSHYPAFFEGRRLPISVCDKLIGMLSYGCADSMISNCPSLPVDIDKMQKMIEIVKNAKDNSNEAPSSLEYHIAGIVQFLSLFANWRFMDFHGQPHARLSSDQRVYHQQKHGLYGRSLGFTLLSLLFFLAPNNYLQDMEMLWTDGYITLPDWESFMNDLLQEWKDILVPSTVMLSVTVSYLAIPGTILSNLNTATFPSQVIIFTSPAQIASTLSIVASVGSIVIDLLLVRYTSTKPKPSSTSSSTYQYQRSRKIFGNESMAIVFSLPWALLMWSIVLFFAALLLSSFAHSNTYTRISVVAMSGIVACLTVWSILTTWRWDHESPLALKRASDSILASLKRFALCIFFIFRLRVRLPCTRRALPPPGGTGGGPPPLDPPRAV